MSDVFTKAKRSEVMSRIRSRGNRATEVALVNLLRRHGITGWRRHPAMFGKPDFVFRPARLVVFVDGCFWHACPRHLRRPASNRGFWKRKLLANHARALLVNRTLRQRGWRVLRIWEHALTRKHEARCVRRILRWLAAARPRVRPAVVKGGGGGKLKGQSSKLKGNSQLQEPSARRGVC